MSGGQHHYSPFTSTATSSISWNATRLCHLLFLKTKDEAFDWITSYFRMIQNQYGKVPKKLHLDNGKELINSKLKEWADENAMEL